MKQTLLFREFIRGQGKGFHLRLCGLSLRLQAETGDEETVMLISSMQMGNLLGCSNVARGNRKGVVILLGTPNRRIYRRRSRKRDGHCGLLDADDAVPGVQPRDAHLSKGVSLMSIHPQTRQLNLVTSQMLLFREFNRGMLDACCDALLSLMLCEQVILLSLMHCGQVLYKYR